MTSVSTCVTLPIFNCVSSDLLTPDFLQGRLHVEDAYIRILNDKKFQIKDNLGVAIDTAKALESAFIGYSKLSPLVQSMQGIQYKI